MQLQNWLSARNIESASLALLLFVYSILALSCASIRYTETIHRVTTAQTFNESLFGSHLADGLAALGFLLLFIGLAFRQFPIRIAVIVIFAVGVTLYIAESTLLEAIGLTTLPFLAGLFLVAAIQKWKSNNHIGASTSLLQADNFDIQRIISAFLIIIIILEIGALARWIAYPLFPSELYIDPSWSFAQLESALFHSLGLLSPFLVVLIAFSFFYKWFIRDFFKQLLRNLRGDKLDSSRVSAKQTEIPSTSRKEIAIKLQKKDSEAMQYIKLSSNTVSTTYATKSSTTKRNIHSIILLTALIIAPFLVAYPHIQSVNPSGKGVSTDEQYYMNWMTKLRANKDATWIETIDNAFTINNGDRPFALLLILASANLTGWPDLMIVRFLPVALAPMLVLANYILIRYSMKSHDDKGKWKIFASVGAIFALFSPQIVVGEYAGFLANWLALIAAYFAFYFLIKGWESQNRNQMIWSFVALFVMLLIIMLVHLYTWANLLAIILLFCIVSYIFTRKSTIDPKIKILLLVLIVGSTFSIDYVKSYYFATPSVAESDSSLTTNIQVQDMSARWERLFFTMNTYVGGFLSNPVILLLALFWIMQADLSRSFDRMFLSMFFILALPIAFGSIEFQTRLLYNIPFQIPALLALYSLNGIRSSYTTSRWLLIIAISLSLASYALRAMTNLYLELPEGYVLDRQFLLP